MKIKKFEGYLQDKYAKYADEKDKYKNQPVVSFPIDLEEIPLETKSLALTLIDYDAVPVCGFPWIHWVVAELPVINRIPADFSRTDYLSIHGKNSYASFFVDEDDQKIIENYVGPTPPDKDHQYTLTVYALDDKVNLNNGFYLNDLLKAMEGHILEIAETKILARK